MFGVLKRTHQALCDGRCRKLESKYLIFHQMLSLFQWNQLNIWWTNSWNI